MTVEAMTLAKYKSDEAQDVRSTQKDGTMEVGSIGIKPKCSMLIDQNVYCEDVPLGHTCFNDAEYTDGVLFYCKECKDSIMLCTDTHITKPKHNAVKMWDQLIKQMSARCAS